MSRGLLKGVATAASVVAGVALIGSGIGAALGGTMVLKGVASATTIAAVASATATVANLGLSITAPKPIARGSIIDVIIEAEPPRPKMLGETFFAGVMVHRAGYGATLKGVPNPFWVDVRVISATGRINGILSENFNFEPIDIGYYANFYTSDQRLGLPGQTAMVPPFGAAPGWDSNSRLEGCAAQLSNYKFDRDGERFASGFPPYGVVGQGAYCYDPRKDSTRPGGSGSHRVDNPATYEYTENVALHAGQYLYGDYINGLHVFGMDLPDDGIDWDAVALWANDCEANNWRIAGMIFEGGDRFSGPEIKKRNLNDICAAGGGRAFEYGGKFSFDWQRPRVPLATIRDADIQEEGGEIITTQSLRDRFNAVLPKWTSPDHQWNQITGEKIVGSTYVAEDGREIVKDWPLNLVRDEQQAGELASYAMADSREVGPITLTLGAEWRFYKPGDCLRIESEEENFESDVVVMNASYDPATLKTTFTLKGETPGKHDFALGRVAVPPPTPIVGQDGAARDAIIAATQLRPEDLAGLDGTAAAKLGDIETGATRGAPAGTNIAGIEATVFASELASAKADAEASLLDLTAIAADGVLSRSEKISARERRDNIIAEFPIWRDRAAAFGISTALRNSYQQSYDELLAYLTAVNVNSNTDTNIVRADFVAAFVNYADARERIIDALTDEASKRATVAGAEAGLINANVPLGANAAVNSDFARGTFGWGFQQGVDLVPVGINLVDVATRTGIRDVWGARYGGGTLGVGVNRDVFYTAALWRQFGPLQNAARLALPCAAGERVYTRARIARERCQSRLFIIFFDKDGTFITAPSLNGGRLNGAVNGDPANFDVVGFSAIAPANTAWAIMMARMVGTGEGFPRVFLIEPAIGKIPVSQTELPPYQVGAADRLADFTTEQPVVGLLDNTTGRATSRRINSQLVASGILQTVNTNPLSASTSGSVSTITVNAHDVFDDAGTISFSSASIGGLNPSTLYYVYETNPDFVGGARSYVATTNRNNLTVFGRRSVGVITTPASGNPPSSGGGGGSGGGWPGGGDIP